MVFINRSRNPLDCEGSNMAITLLLLGGSLLFLLGAVWWVFRG